MLAGNSVRIDVKCSADSEDLVWLKPVIIISNQDTHDWPKALKTRLFLVQCQEKVVDLINTYCDKTSADMTQFDEQQVSVQCSNTIDDEQIYNIYFPTSTTRTSSI